MKRFLLLVLTILLLCGCGAAGTEELPTDAAETSFLNEQGTPWDREGKLVEISLSIPGRLKYANYLEFDEELLLWSIDDHLEDQTILELCLVSLDDGSVLASREISVGGYTVPQPLGKSLYICDNYGGKVLQLDRNLDDVQQWALEANDYSWYYCGDGRIYQNVEYNYLHGYDLTSGSLMPVLEGDPPVYFSAPIGDFLPFEYYDATTGTPTYAVVDLLTGSILQPEKAEHYGTMSVLGGAWLSNRMNAPYTYRFCNGIDSPVSFSCEGYYAQLLEDGLLLTSEDSQYLHLYDLHGNSISSCCVTETSSSTVGELIRSEEQGGYYLIVYSYDSNARLLFWDISGECDLPALTFDPIPEPSAEEAALLQRCERIGLEYGITVRIGENCDTDFFDFTASYATDWAAVGEALDELENALEEYPEGFFRQLYRKAPQGLQIQLIRDLNAYADNQFTEEYAAFVEEHWDCSLMVVDIETADESTYYHEISHVIDSYIQWDSWEREDAIFAEADWEALNPPWFIGYTNDYSLQAEQIGYGAFVDSYSTISPTEDRARVMEYAMSDYGVWTFDDAPILQQKLEYYCKCIRDAFDTTGWPLVARWEQYLDIGIG